MTIESCFKCPGLIALHKSHRDRAIESHETFYCNQGHPQHFAGETQKERDARLAREREANLRVQAERAREEAEKRAARAEEERVKAERDNAATKRALRNALRTSAKLVKTKGRDKARSHHKKKDTAGGP